VQAAERGSDVTGGAAGGPPALHEATLLLQEFLQSSDRFARMLSGRLDVNATDFRAMEHLLRAGSLTPGDLARRLGISSAAVTTSVDRLVARGHVRREPDPADRRRIRVVPAEESSERANGIVSPMVRALDAELTGFTIAEQRAITEYLRRVVDTMRTHAAGGSDDG
jgi:DNA-binding MarR family transcriptional regulator